MLTVDALDDTPRMTQDAQLESSVAQSLMAVSAALARGAPAVEILRKIAGEVQRLSGAESGAVYHLDPDARILRPIAGYHIPKSIPEALLRTPLPLSRWPIIAAALRDRETVSSQHPDWARGAPPAFLGALPRHAALIVPMIVGGEPVGIFYAAWWSPSAELPRLPSWALSTVATSAGAAMQALLVGRDTVTKLQHTETLLAVSRALSSTVDLYSVMRHLLRWKARTLSADMVGAYALQEDGEWLVPIQGYRLPPQDVDALRRLTLSVKTSAFYAAGVAGRRAMFSPNVAEERGIPEAIRKATAHRAQMFVPIVARDRLVGCLIALWVSRTPELQPADFALIESIAAQAGVVVENARLFEANARQVEELSSLHDLARNVTGELERSAILGALHEPLRRGLAADTVELYWRASREADLELIFQIGTDASDVAGLPAAVLREAQPIHETREGRQWLGVPALAGEGHPGRPHHREDRRAVHGIAGELPAPRGAARRARVAQRDALRRTRPHPRGAAPGAGAPRPRRASARAGRDGVGHRARLQQPPGRDPRPCAAPAATREGRADAALAPRHRAVRARRLEHRPPPCRTSRASARTARSRRSISPRSPRTRSRSPSRNGGTRRRGTVCRSRSRASSRPCPPCSARRPSCAR